MSSSSYLNNNPNHFNSLIARIEKTDEVFDLEEKKPKFIHEQWHV